MPALLYVTRLHLLDRMSLTWLPWVICGLTLVVNLAVFSIVPANPDGQHYSGGLLSLYVFLVVAGAQAMNRFLTFGMMLRLSRRRYYLGTLLTMVVLSVVHGLLATLMWAVEVGTGGWGNNVNFFRVPGIVGGSFGAVLLNSVVLMVLAFTLGMWGGLIHTRWKLVGLVIAGVLVTAVILALVWLITTRGWWPDVWAALISLGGTAVAAAIALLLAIGGYGTIRRVTI